MGENKYNPNSQENQKKKEKEQHFYQTLLEQALEDMRLRIEKKEPLVSRSSNLQKEYLPGSMED